MFDCFGQFYDIRVPSLNYMTRMNGICVVNNTNHVTHVGRILEYHPKIT